MADDGARVQLLALTGICAERTILWEIEEVTDANCSLKRFLRDRLFLSVRHGVWVPICAALVLMALSASTAFAESCQTANELDEARRSALTKAALRDFGLIAEGDAASQRQTAITTQPPVSDDTDAEVKKI